MTVLLYKHRRCFNKFFSKQKSFLFLLIIFLLIFITLAIASSSIKYTFEFDSDEGINLMKSLLYLKGFSLYKEIWSDQPPLFTIILSYWLKIFGLSVYNARILILIFSMIFIWAFYETIKIQNGCTCAFIAVIFLILSQDYFRLSSSVMIGIPSLAFTMLSIYCIAYFKEKELKVLLILSGMLIALSLQTKLFTIFLIPIIILEIARSKKYRSFYCIILWLSSALIFYLVIALVFLDFNLNLLIHELFLPHIQSNIQKVNFSLISNRFLIFSVILKDYDTALLAFTGVVAQFKYKKQQFIFPLLWLTLSSFVTLTHTPIWYHHRLLFSIPLSWLAAITLNGIFQSNLSQEFNKKKIFHWVASALIILTFFRLPMKYNKIYMTVKNNISTQQHTTLELVSKYKQDTHWVVTDRPIFAFYSCILVPPELAVMSYKRILTGNLKPEYFVYILNKYKPEQILLNRFQDYDKNIISFIEANYVKIYHSKSSQQGWVPIQIKWVSKSMRLINRMLVFKFPILQGGDFRRFYTEINLFIRKDILNMKNGRPYTLNAT